MKRYKRKFDLKENLSSYEISVIEAFLKNKEYDTTELCSVKNKNGDICLCYYGLGNNVIPYFFAINKHNKVLFDMKTKFPYFVSSIIEDIINYLDENKISWGAL